MSEVTLITHTEKVVAGEVTPITHFEQVIAKYSGGGGGGGFTPTQDQLDAMNSGIDSEKVTQISTNETNISSVTDHIKFSANSKTYYLQPEQPSSPSDGDIWIG